MKPPAKFLHGPDLEMARQILAPESHGKVGNRGMRKAAKRLLKRQANVTNLEAFTAEAKAYAEKTYPGYWELLVRNGNLPTITATTVKPEAWVEINLDAWNDYLSRPEL